MKDQDSTSIDFLYVPDYIWTMYGLVDEYEEEAQTKPEFEPPVFNIFPVIKDLMWNAKSYIESHYRTMNQEEFRPDPALKLPCLEFLLPKDDGEPPTSDILDDKAVENSDKVSAEKLVSEQGSASASDPEPTASRQDAESKMIITAVHDDHNYHIYSWVYSAQSDRSNSSEKKIEAESYEKKIDIVNKSFQAISIGPSAKKASAHRASRLQSAKPYARPNGSDSEMDPSNKRQQHNIKEQQRREDLSNLFEELRQLVPATTDKPASKLMILQSAASYCNDLTERALESQRTLQVLRETHEQRAEEASNQMALMQL